MIRAIWEYIRERKWRYVKIAMVLILYDYTLLIPTQVIQRLGGSFESADADAIQPCMGYRSSWWISNTLNYLTAFLLAVATLFSRSISRLLQGTSVY